jgi:hypothetical protein
MIEAVILLDFLFWFINRDNPDRKIYHFEYIVIFVTYFGLNIYAEFYNLYFFKPDYSVHSIDVITILYGIYFFIQAVYYFFIRKRLTKSIVIVSLIPYIIVLITAMRYADEIFGQN